MTTMTTEEAKKARLDLERRLKIDITQFEQDSGMRVETITLHREHHIDGSSPLFDVEIDAQLSR